MRYSSTRVWSSLRKGMKLLLFLMLVVILVFEAYTFVVVYTEGEVPLPGTFGNFERVRALLADHERRDEFSFAVVGDTRGTGTFESIAEALRHEPLSFMVLLGDCVHRGTSDYHRYFRAEWGKELVMPFPVFYVVGNEDVDEQEFPMSQFEKNYGPSIFCFNYQGHLFIVLNIMGDSYWTKKSMAYLESLLLPVDMTIARCSFLCTSPLPFSAILMTERNCRIQSWSPYVIVST